MAHLESCHCISFGQKSWLLNSVIFPSNPGKWEGLDWFCYFTAHTLPRHTSHYQRPFWTCYSRIWLVILNVLPRKTRSLPDKRRKWAILLLASNICQKQKRRLHITPRNSKLAPDPPRDSKPPPDGHGKRRRFSCRQRRLRWLTAAVSPPPPPPLCGRVFVSLQSLQNDKSGGCARTQAPPPPSRVRGEGRGGEVCDALPVLRTRDGSRHGSTSDSLAYKVCLLDRSPLRIRPACAREGWGVTAFQTAPDPIQTAGFYVSVTRRLRESWDAAAFIQPFGKEDRLAYILL